MLVKMSPDFPGTFCTLVPNRQKTLILIFFYSMTGNGRHHPVHCTVYSVQCTGWCRPFFGLKLAFASRGRDPFTCRWRWKEVVLKFFHLLYNFWLLWQFVPDSPCWDSVVREHLSMEYIIQCMHHRRNNSSKGHISKRNVLQGTLHAILRFSILHLYISKNRRRIANVQKERVFCGEPHLCGQLPINRRQNRFILL